MPPIDLIMRKLSCLGCLQQMINILSPGSELIVTETLGSSPMHDFELSRVYHKLELYSHEADDMQENLKSMLMVVEKHVRALFDERLKVFRTATITNSTRQRRIASSAALLASEERRRQHRQLYRALKTQSHLYVLHQTPVKSASETIVGLKDKECAICPSTFS